MPASEPQLTSDQKVHIYRIIQELLINGVKYVKTGTIELSMDLQLQRFFVFYNDTDVGFDYEKMKHKGLGLNNIFERTKLLGGVATLNTSPGKGTRWTISIPINNG